MRRPWLKLVADYQGQGEAVVALEAYGLESCATEARFGGHAGEHGASALNAGVVALRVCDPAVADYVVGDDERAFVRELQGPIEIDGVVGFVGVDEDEVEGRGVFEVEGGQRICCWAYANLYFGGEAGAGYVIGGDFGVARLVF